MLNWFVRRVIDRERVVEPVIGDALELLGHLQVLPRAHELLALRNVRGLHHQRVAVGPRRDELALELEDAQKVDEVGLDEAQAVRGDGELVRVRRACGEVFGNLGQLHGANRELPFVVRQQRIETRLGEIPGLCYEHRSKAPAPVPKASGWMSTREA